MTKIDFTSKKYNYILLIHLCFNLKIIKFIIYFFCILIYILMEINSKKETYNLNDLKIKFQINNEVIKVIKNRICKMNKLK